jgi:lipoprotein NlpD
MKRYFRRMQAWVPALAAVLLVACASTGPAPVEDRSVGAPQRNAAPPASESRAAPMPGGSYRVERGDTLYSIAFRHGVDYRDLAAWNAISAPYTIYVGRELRLSASTSRHAAADTAAAARPPASAAVAQTSGASVKPAAPAPARPTPSPFENVAVQSATATAPNPPAAPPAPGARAPVASAPAAVAPGAVPATTSTKPASAPPAAPSMPPAASPAGSGEVNWSWPADGQVVGTYVSGDQTRQGVDIAGKAGDPVRSAADGTVVYSGNGLIGYGELIIVKHSPSFLSAYGHNRKRLVKEGDRVKAGQTIAEMGSSSANRDSLHFEIRKNGKPANPVDYLPRR